ncbi:hypothetical protein Aca07nite_19810 [Actinoplanes capillaceus]|uniref:Uncharacterized protein n=1 Tax=Actinoplanes campanulatus TaxID=113559 RepID=A0ABQ3WF81_9ACTN|nr:hypothetical protein [Actinoplanes capillaceus]GID44706.1 hypothetical protein Aca07nite_19810 [Actinoplanes capillaceus]
MSFSPDLLGCDAADRIADLIADLGDTADAIAERLDTAAVTGRPGDATCCPIATYLHHAEPGLSGITVLPDRIEFFTETGDDEHLPTPEPVAEFAARFDDGHYPHLIGSPGHAGDEW